MKPINEITTGFQPSKGFDPSAGPSPVMDRLWLRMTEVYGHQWVSQYGDEPCESWCRMLADVAPDMIAQGLNCLVELDSDWPPNAAVFRKLCKKPTISPDGTNSAAYLPPVLGLPDWATKERGRERGKTEIQKMRELLA